MIMEDSADVVKKVTDIKVMKFVSNQMHIGVCILWGEGLACSSMELSIQLCVLPGAESYSIQQRLKLDDMTKQFSSRILITLDSQEGQNDK